MKKIALVSHGCAKNLVDSELILGILSKYGYDITLNEDETDVVIVNTCSFICDAERESISTILELIEKGKKVAAIEILQLIEQVCFSEEFINFRVDHGSHGERDYIITQIKERYGIE